jgi:integrase/recombinase XerD
MTLIEPYVRRSGPQPPAPVAEDTEALLDRWQLLQLRRGIGQATIDKRRQRLLVLAEYLHPRSVLEATAEDIEQMLDGREVGAKTRYIYLSDFSVFFRAMVRDGLVEANPTEDIVRPRQRAGLPRPIADGDLQHAIATAEPTIAAALTLAACQGLRAAEIAHLQREDVLDANDPPVLYVVEGKGRKNRVLPLHPDVMPALRRAGLPSYGCVLTRPRGGGYPPAELSRAVNSHLRRCGVNATLHQARHWFGTKAYQASRDLRLVQALLGHSSPTTTAVYAQYAPEGAGPTVRSLNVNAKARPSTDTDSACEDPREGGQGGRTP